MSLITLTYVKSTITESSKSVYSIMWVTQYMQTYIV